MKEKNTVGWDPSALRECVERSGLRRNDIAKEVGVASQSLYHYMREGDTVPPLNTVIKLADYFCAPLDFLCGRCSREEAENVLRDYSHCYQAIMRGRYESFLAISEGRFIPEPLMRGVETPYPYNLLDDVIDSRPTSSKEERWETPLSADQQDGFNLALSTLTVRERDMLRMYYEEGKTLNECGQELHLTRERIRQIVAKAVRKLRHPHRLKLILYGAEGYARYQEVHSRKAALDREEQLLDELDSDLASRRKMLEELSEGLCVGERTKPASIYLLPVEEMDLSVRSYNCLRRAGCDTLQDVCDLAKSGKMTSVRNLGRRSMTEVLCKVRDLCGEDFFGVYA